jgi:LPS-assembly protein
VEVTGHESRAGEGAPRKPLWLRARLILSALPVLGLLVTAAVLLAPSSGIARDATDPLTRGTGIRIDDPVRNLTTPKQQFQKSKGGIFGKSPAKVDRAAPLYLQGDELIYDTANNRVIAVGNVEIVFNNYILTADRVVYDQGAQTLTAEGNAQLKEPNGNVVRADKLTATDDFREAFVQALSVTARDDTRITARRAVRREGSVTEFEQGRFTPCRTDGSSPPLWCISAARVIHDQQAGTVTYQDAAFELFGVPVLYTPWFQHADPSVKRRSGFLAPEYGHSERLGTHLEVPYYFALAPNYDFTFSPRYMSQHGVLWQGEWRHRVNWGDIRGAYDVKLAGIDQDLDTLAAGSNPNLDGWRGSVQTRGLFSLSSWWRFGWDITIESDDAFRRFYGLDGLLQTDRINSVFLQGISDRNYFAATFYHFGGLLVEDSADAKSRVMPVIDYNYVVDRPVAGGELSFSMNALSLTRTNVGTTPADGAPREMHRASIDGRWRTKIVDGIGQVWTPYLGVRGDVTSFNNAFDPNTNAFDDDGTVTRATGVAALTYAYPFVKHTQAGSHIVEPVAQVVTRPTHISQNRIPIEDAKSLVWDDTLLFDVDKFSGWDRIETGTRGNVGFQYTYQAAGGGYARFIVGQSYQLGGDNAFRDRDPNQIGPLAADNFPTLPESGLETRRSDYVLGAYFAPVDSFRLVSQSRFDERDLSLRRNDTYTSFTAGPLSAQVQYSYMRVDTTDPVDPFRREQEVQFGGALRLTDRWTLLGGIRYDIDTSERLQDTIQIRYADDCFVLTASYTESFITDPLRGIEPDRAVMLRLEFKHLGQFVMNSNVTGGVGAENQPH